MSNEPTRPKLTLAEDITIDRRTGALLINGEEFPYFVGEDIGIDRLDANPRVFTVNVSIMTERVRFIPAERDAK